jgi:hypothetical protein
VPYELAVNTGCALDYNFNIALAVLCWSERGEGVDWARLGYISTQVKLLALLLTLSSMLGNGFDFGFSSHHDPSVLPTTLTLPQL